VALIPISGVRETIQDDMSALAWLRTASREQLKNQIVLAPETWVAPLPGDSTSPSGQGEAPGAFRPVLCPPPGAYINVTCPAERLTYYRTTEGAPGFLMIPDAWFPGWRAEIDGQPAAVSRANILFKAVWVPTTARQVTFVYEPRSVRIGAAISALAFVLWIGLMVRGRPPLPGVLR
jgi:hypothetical protein